MTARLNISARQLDQEVSYIPFKTNSRAFIESEIEEVIRKNQNIFNKLGIYGSTFGLSMIPNLVSAQTNTNQPIVNESLNPQTMFEFALKIALIGLGASVGVTIILMFAAATVKQLGGEKNRKKSKEWNTDIIKGFIQVLVTIPVVFALYYLATTIFGQLDFTKNTLLNLP